MGRKWDYDVPSVEIWAECLRVLKPGGHLLAFAGTRTQHRMCCRIEDAGFEIRDMIAWVYGSGFPKSLDVGKAIDSRKDWNALRLLQAKVRLAREALGISQSEAARRVGMIGPNETLGGGGFMWFETGMRVPTRHQYPALKAALGLDDECDEAFEAAEREVVGQKTSGIANRDDRDRHTVGGSRSVEVDITAPATAAAKKWHGWGTALKPALEPITVARKPLIGTVAENVLTHGTGAINVDGCRVGPPIEHQPGGLHRGSGSTVGSFTGRTDFDREPHGRWPSNLIHDGSEEVVGLFPTGKPSTKRTGKRTGTYGEYAGQELVEMGHDDDGGSAARFFYCAKASKSDRGDNRHPTVKPTDLMRYLCRLVTPPGGVVLDPFTGSGSTGKAARLEGFRFIGIEREAEYVEIAKARINASSESLLCGSVT